MNPVQIDPGLIYDTLRQVIDPELDCNIVDLGLIYRVIAEGSTVRVTMTLTTPGCPMGQSIAWGVETALLRMDAVETAEVEVVWDPPWSPSRMTEQGRVATGIRQ